MPHHAPLYDDDSIALPTSVDHSGARWMVAVGVCLLMLGVACVL